MVDTWWQTETGGILITPLPGAHTLKPGSASRPFFGVEPIVLDDQGNQVPDGTSGKLCITKPWPGIMRTTYGDHDRFIQTYFSAYKGMYFTGDGARRDVDGDYWLLGRVDDVINVSGHRLGTAEVESALVSHPSVAEAAVVGYPHDIKGQGIYAYVTLKSGIEPTDELRAALVKHVRKQIGPIATPGRDPVGAGLPKTRSGKIMRRILRKIAENELDKVGDITTLADPSVVEHLVANRREVGSRTTSPASPQKPGFFSPVCDVGAQACRSEQRSGNGAGPETRRCAPGTVQDQPASQVAVARFPFFAERLLQCTSRARFSVATPPRGIFLTEKQ